METAVLVKQFNKGEKNKIEEKIWIFPDKQKVKKFVYTKLLLEELLKGLL